MPNANFAARFVVAGLAFFSSMILSPFAGAAIGNESLCRSVFMTAKTSENSSGVLEQHLLQRQNVRKRIQAKIEEQIETLEGLEPELVAHVTKMVVAERAIKKMFPGERLDAVQRLAEELRLFADFKSLSSESREQLAKLLLQGNRDAVTGVFGTKHLLYEAAVFRDRNAGYAANLASVQSLYPRVRFEEELIESGRTLIAARNAKDVAELRSRRAKLETEILAQKFVDADVVSAVVEISELFHQREAGMGSIVSGATLATMKWNELTKSHVFFQTLSGGDLQDIGSDWQRGKTPLEVIKMFGSRSKAAPPGLSLRIRDLGEIDAALSILEAPQPPRL